MSWIVILRLCTDCGGDVAFQIFDNKPTEKEISNLEKEFGSFSCASKYIKEIKDGVNVIINN